MIRKTRMLLPIPRSRGADVREDGLPFAVERGCRSRQRSRPRRLARGHRQTRRVERSTCENRIAQHRDSGRWSRRRRASWPAGALCEPPVSRSRVLCIRRLSADRAGNGEVIAVEAVVTLRARMAAIPERGLELVTDRKIDVTGHGMRELAVVGRLIGRRTRELPPRGRRIAVVMTSRDSKPDAEFEEQA